MKPLLTLLSATGLSLALATARPQLSEERGADAATFGAALGLELSALDLMLPFVDAARKEVAKATDCDSDSLAEARTWIARQALADGRSRELRLGRLPFEGRGDEGFVLLALDEERRFVAAAVLDQDGDAMPSWKHFLQAFGRSTTPRMNGARPRSHLARVREKARSDGNENGQLTLALFDFLGHMQAQARADELPPDPGRDPVAECRERSRSLLQAASVTPGLATLLGSRATEFTRLAKDAAAAAEALATACAAGDRDATLAGRERLRATCTGCHALEIPERGPVKPLFRSTRAELGIGDGYWVVGHDLPWRHADREQAQAVADRLRQLALLLDLATTW